MKKSPTFAVLVIATLTGFVADSALSHEATQGGSPLPAEQPITAYGTVPASGWYPPPPPNAGRYSQPRQQQPYWRTQPRGYSQMPPPYPPQGRYQSAPAAPAVATNPLSAELKYTQEQLTAKSTELGKANATLEQLRVILQHRLEAEITLNEKLAAITGEQQALQARVDELSSELGTATTSLEDSRKQIANDQNHTIKLTSERDGLRNDLASRETRLATLQVELQATAQALEQKESETAISGQKLADALTQAEGLRNELTLLQSQLEDQKTALQQTERSLTDMTTRRDSLQAELNTRSKELTQAQAALTEAESGSKQSLADVTAERDALQQELTTHRAQLAQAQAALTEAESGSKQSLADATAERDALQQELATHREQLAQAQAALTTTQSDLHSLRQAQTEAATVVASPTPNPEINEETVPAVAEIAALQTTELDTDRDGIPDSTDLCGDTQQNVNVDGTGCANGVAINLEGVNFHYDSHELTSEARRILDRIADILSRQPDLRLEVAGHTDSQGDPAYNQWLSLKRAEAVRDYIVAQGVNPNHIGAGGYGGQRPIADNSTKEGLRMNRRVELRRLQ